MDETYIKARGRWCYLYRAIDRDGALVDVMLSERRDLAAAKRFFRSAEAVTGTVPDLVTSDGHDAYPRARAELGETVKHRTSVHLNNRLEQDHRGIGLVGASTAAGAAGPPMPSPMASSSFVDVAGPLCCGLARKFGIDVDPHPLLVMRPS